MKKFFEGLGEVLFLGSLLGALALVVVFVASFFLALALGPWAFASWALVKVSQVIAGVL